MSSRFTHSHIYIFILKFTIWQALSVVLEIEMGTNKSPFIARGHYGSVRDTNRETGSYKKSASRVVQKLLDKLESMRRSFLDKTSNLNTEGRLELSWVNRGVEKRGVGDKGGHMSKANSACQGLAGWGN